MKNNLHPMPYRQLIPVLLAVVFLLFNNTPSLNAQKSDTIGFGNTAANIYGPAHISSTGTSNASYSSKTINLFTQSELAGIGINPGAVLNSIAWQKSTVGVMINGASVNISVSLRSNIDSITYGTSITSNKYINDYVGSNFTLAGSKLFSSAGTNFPATATWVPITFSTPYTYQGGALEVLMDAVYTPGPGANPPNAASAAINWYSTPTRPLYQCIYTNGVTSYASTTVYYYADSRANTVFNFTPAASSCSGTPVAGSIKTTVVTACPGMLLTNLRLKGASSVSGIKLQWEKKVSGQSAFTPIAGATKYELVQELVTTATEYRVVVSCGANSSTSPATNIVPTPFITPNYTYDFETGAAWFASTVPDCWLTRKGLLEDTVEFKTNVAGYDNGSWASDGWLNVGTFGAARINPAAFTYDWLISPGIGLGSGNWQLEFDLGIFTRNAATAGIFDEDDLLAVVISTDGGATWNNSNTLRTWTAAQTPLSANGTQHVVLPLTSYSGNIAIGFYGTGSGLNPISPALPPDVMIDNFKIVPSCNPRKPDAITGTVLACRNAQTSYSVPQVSGITSYTWTLPSGWSGSSTTNTIAVTPDVHSGSIKVVANSASCGSSDTQTLNIVISPLPAINPADSFKLCAGDEAKLVTATATSYQWLQDQTLIANAKDSVLPVSKAGNYRVITQNGACNDTSLTTTIIINPLPTPAILQEDNVISTTQIFNTYQWNFNDTPIPGAKNASYVVTDSGAYSVTVTDENGCEATSDPVTTTASSTSIDGFGLNSQHVKIYPNPAKDIINIMINRTLKGDETIIVQDIAGKVLLTQKINGVSNTLNISSLSSGIYFIKVGNNETTSVHKITKN